MSCSRTYATLRLFSEDLDPERIAALLGIAATDGHRRGETRGNASPFRQGSWRLSSEHLRSTDVREHVDWILEQIEPVAVVLAGLQEADVRQDVFCYWATDNGQGGPSLGASQMRRLAALRLSIGFDVYRV